MSRPRHRATRDLDDITKQAQELLAATADVTEEKVAEARKRLNEALEQGKEVYNDMREGAMASAKAAHEFIHENPYAALGIGVGVGVLLGFLLRGRD
jgi:ElaB/YqjD/DUF883 family membrane-anchored ribosome-binding protein